MITKQKISPNLAQSQAIETIEGPVMVLAGPGSGKTFTLIHRIKHMLELGIDPKNILCLTFSDAASREMKNRVASMFGASANSVTVSTYHSFCLDIIKQFPSRFLEVQNVSIIDDITKVILLKEALDESNIEHLKDKWGNKYRYVKDILGSIEKIKRERINEEDYLNNIKTNPSFEPLLLEYQAKYNELQGKRGEKTALKNLECQNKKVSKALEVYQIYKLYNSKLQQKGLIDFADMINLVINELDSNIEFLEEALHQYKYVMVDEYQDTNSSQNKIIFLTLQGAKTDNIFVVGDDDQIIYGFQGANCNNLETFLYKFPNTKIICLNENRRSAQNILDFSKSIIENDPTRLSNNPEFKNKGIDKTLIAKNEDIISKEQNIEFTSYFEEIQEHNDIVKKIEKLIQNPEQKLSQIAVLMNKNDKLKELSKLFENKNIPFVLREKKSVFDLPPSLLVYFYIKALIAPTINSDKIFALLASEPFKINDSDYEYLLRLNRVERKDFITLINQNPQFQWQEPEKINQFLNTYNNLKNELNSRGIYTLVKKIINETGILEHFFSFEDSRFENMASLRRILEEASAFKRLYPGTFLRDFALHLDTYLNEKIPLVIENDMTEKNAVALLTYHGSKGREFEHVFMPDLRAKSWETASGPNQIALPITTSVFSEDKEENIKAECLKKLFVGITRAKFGLYLSAAENIDGAPQVLSNFISPHLQNVDYKVAENSKIENEFYEQLKIETPKNINELRFRLSKPVISASSLNTFLDCPMEYLFKDVYRVPVFNEDPSSLNYGNAFHSTLEFALMSAKEKGCWPLLIRLNQIFEEKLKTFEFKDEATFNDFLNRGLEKLEGFYPYLCENKINEIYDCEHKFDFTLCDYEIKGFLDFIKKDKEGNFHLYDFKTGSKKSLGRDPVLRGKNKYLNQLKFYKYAFELKYPDYKVINTELVFVEEPESYVNAVLGEEDIEDIKEKINLMLTSIRNLDFKAKPSRDTCEFCNYKLLCKLKVV